ncbi:MAG: dienelactone hydrolase family protein [Xanthobacteraceae bacterium]
MTIIWVITVLLGAVFAQVVCADDLIRFESASYRVGELQQRLARERGETIKPQPATTIEAYLSKPEGDGPFPAVVSLHGCSGLSPSSRMVEADFFNALGYVSFVVDSFSTRRIVEACVSPIPNRHADALGALSYLSKLPFVDAKRIALIGRSQGGIVALQVASTQPVDVYDIPVGLAYKAIVAFYPFCGAATEELAIPALIMIGDADDWTPAKECKRWMAQRAGRGAPVKFIVYPGAHHAFDAPITGAGMQMFGHLLKYDPEAAKQATTEVREFLRLHLTR